MAQMKFWAKSDNEHLRRLASEGCRPRLPWAVALPKFKQEPSKVLQILQLLKNDKSEYVRKSVANVITSYSIHYTKLYEIFEKAFDCKLEDGKVWIDGCLSRKKQIIPFLEP